MSKVYFISGHLDISAIEFLYYYRGPITEAILENDATFVVGDAKGTDTLAQDFLYSIGAEYTVYHMFEHARNNPHNAPTSGGWKNDEERDAAMTRASDEDIAWVRPGRESSGTAKNLERRKVTADEYTELKKHVEVQLKRADEEDCSFMAVVSIDGGTLLGSYSKSLLLLFRLLSGSAQKKNLKIHALYVKSPSGEWVPDLSPTTQQDFNEYHSFYKAAKHNERS
jgi:hypothetical protein